MKRTRPKSPMGERIFLKMEELGLNAKQLSLSAGLNETYVRDLLNSEDPNPRLRHVTALAKELGVSVAWLDTGSDGAEIVDIWTRIPSRDRLQFQQYGESLAKREGDKSA